MKIIEFAWSNYRRLPDAQITLRNHLALIGPNDTGKSSVLRAVNLCLGMSQSHVFSSIVERDFTDPGQPLKLEVTLGGISDEEKQGFPDEIDIGPPEVLRITLEAELDATDPSNKDVRRFFPDSGHQRSPSRLQQQIIGWQFVPASRSLLRELGGQSGGAIQSLLASIDISADTAALREAAARLTAALDGATSLASFRKDLAASLTGALPRDVEPEHLRLSSPAALADDPLAGVTLTLEESGSGYPAALSEQSDGIRALIVLALLGMAQRSAKIVGIDEPETHLHTTAQRSIGRSIEGSAAQRLISTHSAAVVSQLHPLDIVAFGTDKRPRQLPLDAQIAGLEPMTRHWSHRMIDPLTARRVVLVEGVSDRILVEKVARLRSVDLDRAGAVLFELNGKSLFPTAWKLFGSPGFDISVCGLLDEDAQESWSKELGIPSSDLRSKGYVVCEPDLEGMYVDCLGLERAKELLFRPNGVPEVSVVKSCGITDLSALTVELLTEYCRGDKVRCALALSSELTLQDANLFTNLVALLAIAAA